MAHSLSAKKRMRQNETRRVRNRARKSVVKTQTRRFTEAVAARDVETSETELRKACRLLDRIAAKGTMHKNTVARRKSSLQKRFNALKAR